MIVAYAQNSSPSLICENFSQTSGTFMLFFTRVFFSSLMLWELRTIKFVICIFKARLGGETCLADVVMHMIRTIIQVSAGHYCSFQMISFFAHPFTCRYKNPVDIPLGNAKQKIKSLKARVCNQKRSY